MNLVEAIAADADADDRWTPQWLFDRLNLVHRFTLDAAASFENAKCAHFFSRDDDGLTKSWRDQIVWVNPPFSDLSAWVAYARHQVNENGCPKVVMILPANRTEQPWWHEHIEPYRDNCRGGVRVRFLPKRVNFGKSGDPEGKKYKSNVMFGICVVVFTPEGA